SAVAIVGSGNGFIVVVPSRRSRRSPAQRAVAVADRSAESEPVGQVHVGEQHAVESQESHLLVAAGEGTTQFKSREESLAELNAVPAQGHQQASHAQAIPLARLIGPTHGAVSLIVF